MQCDRTIYFYVYIYIETSGGGYTPVGLVFHIVLPVDAYTLLGVRRGGFIDVLSPFTLDDVYTYTVYTIPLWAR